MKYILWVISVSSVLCFFLRGNLIFCHCLDAHFSHNNFKLLLNLHLSSNSSSGNILKYSNENHTARWNSRTGKYQSRKNRSGSLLHFELNLPRSEKLQPESFCLGHSVHPHLPFSFLGVFLGVEAPTKFSTRGSLTGFQFLEEGCWERGGRLFSGGFAVFT